MYQLAFTSTARKDLRKISGKSRKLVDDALARLKADPDSRALDVRKLQGREGYRMRVGDYRILYDRDDMIRVIAVQRIAPRGGAYRP